MVTTATTVTLMKVEPIMVMIDIGTSSISFTDQQADQDLFQNINMNREFHSVLYSSFAQYKILVLLKMEFHVNLYCSA
jgi:hypothetical protein